MIIGYGRVSLASQDASLQIDALERAGCEKIFIETGSGARNDRPELARALEVARAGDVLVVYSLSRLSRSLRHTLEIVDDLAERKIDLRSLTEPIDTSTTAGKLMLTFCGILNQAERETLRQRTRDGLAAAALRGRRGGRPRSLDESKLRIARALMQDDSLSMREIADQIGVAPSTLYRSLPGGRSAAEAA